jgi:hypothetical protein
MYLITVINLYFLNMKVNNHGAPETHLLARARVLAESSGYIVPAKSRSVLSGSVCGHVSPLAESLLDDLVDAGVCIQNT